MPLSKSYTVHSTNLFGKLKSSGTVVCTSNATDATTATEFFLDFTVSLDRGGFTYDVNAPATHAWTLNELEVEALERSQSE